MYTASNVDDNDGDNADLPVAICALVQSGHWTMKRWSVSEKSGEMKVAAR